MTKTLLKPTNSLDALLERLSPEPHLRGKEFERAAKWFLETDSAYASEIREVWLWDDWPGRWGPDIGIDLVAETQEGKLWGIQVSGLVMEHALEGSGLANVSARNACQLVSDNLFSVRGHYAFPCNGPTRPSNLRRGNAGTRRRCSITE